jgi:hypothetical protein
VLIGCKYNTLQLGDLGVQFKFLFHTTSTKNTTDTKDVGEKPVQISISSKRNKKYKGYSVLFAIVSFVLLVPCVKPNPRYL